MVKNYMAIIYVGEGNENISPLTKARSLASIPVGGSYRIIDFALSNVVNAGIRNVGLFCGNEELNSLTDHIGNGFAWDLARKKDGIFIFKQMMDNHSSSGRSRIHKNMEYFFRSSQEKVIVLNSHMVCNLDVNDLIEKHEASGKEITMVYKKVKDAHEHFNHCSSVKIDEKNRVLGIGQNLFFHEEENISVDAFVISKELVLKLLIDSIQEGNYNTLPELVAKKLPSLNVNAYEFTGYLQCINSTREYFDFNMKILQKDIREDVFGVVSGRNILTKVKDTPPSLFKSTALVENSLISNGCIIEGTVKNSILSRGAVVEKGVVLEDCVILQDCHIRKGAVLKNVIVDKNNVIHEHEKLSASKDYPLVIEKSMTWDSKQYQNLMKYIKKR
ncbi:glucose-1-phosphate adenylyltransferase subunit GlgD [Fusobacterium necrophorum subsp. funduliforme]|uniref:Glucose-1-phosphate adenylyltransferase, GlgD subunit n=2 Tax=Fusobacterium necrophorum TaxID=859 RepID=A0AAN3VWU7_9FUSO|nr:glucose-1-phosphate adenylyltransferase subunit GlgD [Fusobacterium necrophorum]AYV95065.1 glucose-1-phosphate adenylyltransferase subunit GlgD [Fusobacterium necrophorum subsp. funduliforme]EJU18565.1 glucose-1-phosphate adenylyltransferase, GlgD subunit [Fusobacterium necrophorum subsp. funduliforme Fnf 1007]KYL01398.1 glucose-1-phosphate adenylyltransferase subunit GlgD [Fusobacterium necrophorum subsp. funduliforme]KYL03704.1 glucose-1-phosphate adenylyltransferase subunit GlgD [Fusobact